MSKNKKIKIFSDEEMLSFAPPKDVSTEEWGAKNRELSVGTSASGGAWSLDMIPFFKPILAALDNEKIETVVIKKASQIAGTETILTWLGKCMSQDPGPAMVCLADEDTAGEVCERRIQPMFRTAKDLSELIIPAKFNKENILLRNSGSITMAWASSIARTASRPIRYLIMDEICKPAYSQAQAEGSVITRILQRTETFSNRKIIMLSSVTIEGDNMSKQMELCDEIFEWAVPCPFCGAFQPLRFRPVEMIFNGDKILTGGIVWDNSDGIRESSDSARYECFACKERWTTAQKNAAVSRGCSMPRMGKRENLKRVGFHLPRLISLFPGGRLEALVESFLLAKNDPLELQSFLNNALAEHWIPRIKETSENEILAARSSYPRGVVPEMAVCLVCGIDTQQTGFWYRVRAWATDLTSWGVDEGFVSSWQELEELLFMTEFSGKKIWRALIDSGGTRAEGDNISRTEDVYWWIRKNGIGRGCRVFPTKGASRAQDSMVKIGSPIDKTPSGKSLQGSIQIISIDTDMAKESLFYRLDQARQNEPGGFWLHSETDNVYVSHLRAEEKRRTKQGGYEWVRVRKDNHLLDCEVGCIAAVDPSLFGGIRPFITTKPAPPKSTNVMQALEKNQNSGNPFMSGIQNPSLFGFGGNRR